MSEHFLFAVFVFLVIYFVSVKITVTIMQVLKACDFWYEFPELDLYSPWIWLRCGFAYELNTTWTVMMGLF